MKLLPKYKIEYREIDTLKYVNAICSIIKTQHHQIARKIKDLRLYTATNPLMPMKHCFTFEERPSYTWIGGSDYSVEGR